MEVLDRVVEPGEPDVADWGEPPSGGSHWGRTRPPLRLVVLDEAGQSVDLRRLYLYPQPSGAVRRHFEALADEWTRESEFVSVQSKAVAMRPYQRIIAIGPSAVRLLLQRLRDRPDHWFWALSVLTNEDPATGLTSFEEARLAWLEWGGQNDLLD